MRTLPVFFGVLELLLRAGVTTVAEAAFQDRIWRPRLEALRGLARFRVVHCTVDHGGGRRPDLSASAGRPAAPGACRPGPRTRRNTLGAITRSTGFR